MQTPSHPLNVGTREAARLTGLSVRSLEKMRAEGRGPAFRRFGRRILYPVESLTAWTDTLPRGGVGSQRPLA